MANNKKIFEDNLIRKLDSITELLENLIILQGASVGIKKQELRKIAGVGMNRVTSISRFVKEPKLSKDIKK